MLLVQNRLGRRAALRIGVVTGSSLVVPSLLSGCANKPPPAPPPPPKPLSLLVVLPAVLATSAESTGFGAKAQARMVIPYSSGPRGGGSGPGAAAVIGLGLIGLAIGYGIQQSRQKEREQLLAALAEVDFDARAALDEHLSLALQESGVPFARVTDLQASAAVEAGRLEGLPTGADAILAIEVAEQGYYASSRAGGLSPILHVNATIKAAGPKLEELDGFTYYADWRNGDGDTRWITTPKSSIFKTPDELRSGAAVARADLKNLVEQFARKISADVARHAKGQLRVD